MVNLARFDDFEVPDDWKHNKILSGYMHWSEVLYNTVKPLKEKKNKKGKGLAWE